MKDIKKIRPKVEERIYKIFRVLDPTGQNTEYYKKKFMKMNDKEFFEFFNQDFPLKFQTKVFEIDPKVTQIMKALKMLNVPITEKVNMPFIYKNKEGTPVKSQPVLVVYLPLKRLKQMVIKKSGFSVDISKRDYRTGLLIDTDKNGNSTDREFESLVVMDLDKTLTELSTVRADAMDAKNSFYNQINTTGIVSLNDVEIKNSDSIARNLLSAYLLCAHIQSNLINIDYLLPRTIKYKNAGKKGLSRED